MLSFGKAEKVKGGVSVDLECVSTGPRKFYSSGVELYTSNLSCLLMHNELAASQ